jgi:mRNA-degrading endonuclease RelE of RelBE toxin-antitoxin system
MYSVNTLEHFDRELKKLAKKYPSIGTDLKKLVGTLIENPFQGDNLGKDCFKVRVAISSKNKGKSGGARVITCVKITGKTITLLSIYDKSVQTDIADGLLQQLLQQNGLL